MAAAANNTGRIGAIVATLLLVAAIPVGILWTLEYGQAGAAPVTTEAGKAFVGAPAADDLAAQRLRTVTFSWIGVISAAAAAVLLVLVIRGRPAAYWLVLAAVAPITYAILSAAPAAASLAVLVVAPGKASLELLPVARLLLLAGAAAAYIPVALALGGRLQYGVCCGTMAVAAVFFAQWEPPPPKPVPIAKSLATLETAVLDRLNDDRRKDGLAGAWKAKVETLPPEVEKALGADEYLNLQLTSPEGGYGALVFVTYNANAMSRVPHVPWVCMTQAGFTQVDMRQDDLPIVTLPDREIRTNVLLFQKGEARALMFQYFNVGRAYTTERSIARFLATSGSIGHAGSYLSQTQIAVWLPPGSPENPMAKGSGGYGLGLRLLNILVPLLERDYYPDLHGGTGG
jgi:hypothetical protein